MNTLEKKKLNEVKRGINMLEINANNETVSVICLDLTDMIDAIIAYSESENLVDVQYNHQCFEKFQDHLKKKMKELRKQNKEA